MDKVMCVRKRGKNVSERDKCLLMEIMKIHINSIESKKHDAKMLNKKRDTWKVVTDEFNASSDEKRTEEQLKVLWKDLKAKAKKQKARETREKYNTGGDSHITYVDDVSKVIIEIMPQVFEGIDSVCDDDIIIENFVENSENCMKTQGSDGVNVADLEGELGPSFDISEDSNPDVTMNVYAGSSTHDFGSNENRAGSSGQESNINHRHEELHKMQLKFLRKEHEEKMVIMQRQREMQEEAHALRMDIMQSLKNKLSVIPIEGSLNFINYLDKASEVNEIQSETSE